jgi:hypothetical protein
LQHHAKARHAGPWRLLQRAGLATERFVASSSFSEVFRVRKTNYKQQKKSREEARKVRKTEKLGRRDASTTKPSEAGDPQTPDNKSDAAQ